MCLRDRGFWELSSLVSDLWARRCAYVLRKPGQAGVSLPRTSEAQAGLVQSLGGWTTNIAQLVPGDLVFFAGSDGTVQNPGHVGIYLGNDQMIQAPETGEVVDIVTISAGPGFAGGGPVSGLGSVNGAIARLAG
ncbi:MAG: NlpC/P60 family protein [Actinomycetota bacterium]|nr:NlpC/P60 family protein [Actinomycetota bacterium]MDA8314981.1 NlpC/P60 family protein [Actinomycetota bacterium]